MIRLTHHGFREMVVGSILLGLLAALFGWLWWPATLVIVALWVFLLAFFRDPERVVGGDQKAMVSPADGTVADITELADCPLVAGPAVRVGIFLSVFNVHVNRAPCAGRISSVTYKKGKFINAMSHAKASEENECNTLVISGADGQPVAAVRQIVGLIARRIVCAVAVDQQVERGQRIGMIKFGSRTELYIPKRLSPQVLVKIGQPVRGAVDVIATIGQAI